MPSVILVVEDEPLIQMSISSALEDAGFRVVTAETADGAEAAEAIAAPSFVLMDLNLGLGRDGVAAATTIRMRRPQLPIAFLTAHADARSIARMETVSPCGILQKPFDEDRLVELVRRFAEAAAA